MKLFNKVIIISDKLTAWRELIAGGRQMGEQVAVIACGKQYSAMAFAYGADMVYQLGEPENMILEDYTETILKTIKSENECLVLVHNSKRGKLIAGRLAAALGSSALTDVSKFITNSDVLQTERIVFGGAAVRREQVESPYTIVLAASGLFALAPEDQNKTGIEIEVEFVPPVQPVRLIERKSKTSASVDLNAAKTIIGVGRGFRQKEDLNLVTELADLIGAEVGCTRPIAETEKWMPKETYIGVSGIMQLKPELYFAIGISGQIQHTIGINQAKTIVAINENKAAPIFKYADYGIVGDLYKVLPELINRIKAKA